MTPQVRNLALYVPIVLPAYALTGAAVDALTRAEPRLPFWTSIGLWAAVGWWVPLVFAPAALVLLGLAARLPHRWPRGARRAVLLVAAPPLFAGAMGAAAYAASGNTAILTAPHVAVVIVPALAYAAVVHLPEQLDYPTRRST